MKLQKKPQKLKVKQPKKKGLKMIRVLSQPDQDPFDMVSWETRSAAIRDDSGRPVFEQHDIEVPVGWSNTALNVVASKYFRGSNNTPDREKSVRDLITRVVDTITKWGYEQEYFDRENASIFRDELICLLLLQKVSFNSPVWFNVGTDPAPQCSACFILSVEDTMESILQWYAQEGMIFKGGSGSGVNISKLRSTRELVTGGGTASGPVSFMKAADASAGVIKSGGKTRRAAKMVILNIDHPNVFEFIKCKAREEEKAQALIKLGYDSSFDGEVYSTIAFQNSNHSVRVTDEFMIADKKDETWETKLVLSGEMAEKYRARDVLKEIAKAAYICGDPGIQFDTMINRMHTCPATAPIYGSNPCSEYMHVDDSACNLASLKLTAFLNEENDFNMDLFRHAVDIMITAQDILVDKASYPSPAIEKNSHNLRALGLGFADLGAFVMRLGLPYDSDAARAWASVITALLTGEAYCQSARIAKYRGSFAKFSVNRDAMIGVLGTHRKNLWSVPVEFPGWILQEASEVWDEAIRLGERFGYANCQTTVMAPTGTIAFMMDCATTGIEPEIALVKYKTLSGGGRFRIVNKIVPHALKTLGYSPDKIDEIVAKIEETGTIEDIEGFNPEHLPVFDCAFRPIRGKRLISPAGHLKMMAAIQPFLSGAISKTINLPNDCSVEDIEDIYREAWRMGLKSVSVYRDGCKAVQPLGLEGNEKECLHPIRRRLSVDCKSIRHKFEFAGQKGYIHAGFYDDETLGEIFIRMAKEGSTVSGLMDTIATLTSIALQYGVPLEALVNKFSHVRFEPSGFTTNRDVPYAKSLTDYIFRFLGTRFLSNDQKISIGLLPIEESTADSQEPSSSLEISLLFNSQSDAPACYECGAIMVRNGSCYKCLNCGASNGCS